MATLKISVLLQTKLNILTYRMPFDVVICNKSYKFKNSPL